MELLDVDESGRRGVKEIEDSNYQIECDMVVMALGTKPNPMALNNSNIQTDEKKIIITKDTKTSDEMVFAGGDAVTGAATVILAMEAGKKAAIEIVEKFKKNIV